MPRCELLSTPLCCVRYSEHIALVVLRNGKTIWFNVNMLLLSLSGDAGNFWAPDYATGSWRLSKEVVQPLIKVETHNHPTAISPFPGAATGSGGEIRDEGAVGRGSSPKAGLCGFWVSDLLIPDKKNPWENEELGRPAHYASALDIMLTGPIGAARFNNEFGRPALSGMYC
jgi:phosphoribosylformylglycinamidine synthase